MLLSVPGAVTTERSFTPNSAFSPLNSAYLTPEGKIDKQKLFAYILQDSKRMSWLQLKTVVMKVANIQSSKFADTLLNEALSEQLIRPFEVQEGNNLYELHDGQSNIF